MDKHLTPILSIVAGICVLMFPVLVNYVVGIWLIVTGLLAYSKR